jgi:hypothetical protein
MRGRSALLAILGNMPEVLVATPLKYSAVSQPYQFGAGISIREISPIRWDRSITNSFISKRDQENLEGTRYWLCAATVSGGVGATVEDELTDAAHHAALALQIICPIGAKRVFLKFHQTSEGWDIDSSHPPKELCNTLLGRITRLEEQRLVENFDHVYAGIRRAFADKVVRLQNPIQLLEHGMQIGNVNLGALMFVMALDMLVGAGNISKFMQRVGGFFSLDSLIFPADQLRRQANTTVRHVIEDLYDFRNIVAHGQEIPKHPYRKKYDLTTADGERINYDDYYYAELMLESGLFLLTAALRKVFIEDLFDEFADPEKWKRQMTVFEHRYKDAGGHEPTKRRGR